MNTIHLCRGKRLDNGDWETGFYYRTANGTRIHEVQDETPFCPETNVHLVDPATVGRCTGLLAAKSYRGDAEADRLVWEGGASSGIVIGKPSILCFGAKNT